MRFCEVLQFAKGKQPKKISAVWFVFCLSDVRPDQLWTDHSSVNKCTPEQAEWNVMSPLPLNKVHWQTQELRQWCHHSCNLALMHFFFYRNRSSLYETDCTCTYIFINSKWSPPPLFTVHSVIFCSTEGSEVMREEERESKEGEDKHVLRALFCLILYQLSSLGPSEKLNHKRVQSLEDILFLPPWIHYIIA